TAPTSTVREQPTSPLPQSTAINPNPEETEPAQPEVTVIPTIAPPDPAQTLPQFTSTTSTPTPISGTSAISETLAIAPPPNHKSTHSTISLPHSPTLPLPSSPLPHSPTPLLAQVDPSQDRFPTDSPPPEPLPEEVPADPPPPTDTTPPDDTTPFFVTDIQVTGSTLFDEATLNEIVAPYENLEVTLRELQAAADAITQLYLDGGYITSRAIVGPQTITGGVVEIQVLEGELEDIQVEGTTRLQDYVRARVSLGGTRPLNQARLEDQLRLLRVDPMFDSVEASLRAGSGVGKSRLIVRVTEANTIGGALFSDNYSPPAVGEVRFGARLEFRNLAGLGDTLFSSASVTNTEGSNVYEIGYRVPINPMNGTVVLRYAPNDFRITDPEQPAFELDTEGSTDTYEITVRQPLIRTPRDEFALSLGYRYREGSTLIGGTITNDSRINVFSFGQDYVHRDVNGAWALQSQFRVGNEDRSDFGADSDEGFFNWRGQVQRVQRLGPDHLLILQGSLQLSPDSLPGSEQFFVGGGLSVRGYDQNQRFGDNGLRFAIEDQITVVRDETGLPFFQVSPFLEGGYVWNNDDDTSVTDNNFLLGAGVGFLITPTEKLSLRADLAYPLIDIEELSTDDAPGLRFYFSTRYRF
ncbi:MAG: ShlB/FhaC/HecB family hemolysin secretion/activation protein, partial [Cyanobacteria bacterium J06636_16]